MAEELHVTEGSSAPRCANPGCLVGQGGRCLEGFDPADTCPQFGKFRGQPPTKETLAAPTRAAIGLARAETLTDEEAHDILGTAPSRVIAIVGPASAGKTSLIGSLYDQFLAGRVGEFAFCRSRSLQSFELAVHDSRAASKRPLPDMSRTPLGDVRFYHLQLLDPANGAQPNVLLADRAGEAYFYTHNDPDLARGYPELARADVLTLMIDGERLLDSGQRHNVRSEARLTVQAFIDAEVIRGWQRVAVVLTKIDAVRSHEACDRAQKDFDDLVASLRKSFADRFADIQSFKVAASPKSGDAARGEGVPELLAFWMSAPLRFATSAPPAEPVQPERYFARFVTPLKKGRAHG